jgi:non-structural maintenance of chromosomes element 1
MAPLSWRHHTLLQALLSRGPLSEREFHAVFAALSGKNPGKPSSLYASLPDKCSTKCSCAMPG